MLIIVGIILFFTTINPGLNLILTQIRNRTKSLQIVGQMHLSGFRLKASGLEPWKVIMISDYTYNCLYIHTSIGMYWMSMSNERLDVLGRSIRSVCMAEADYT
jgi:hypothetical protein